MSANSTIICDPGQLTNSDLIEEYDKLGGAYRQLQRTEERQLQQIYELKRQLQTVTNAETHLTAELEFIAGGHAAELAKQQQRHRAELGETRSKLTEAQEANASADAEQDRLRNEVAELRKTIDELKSSVSAPTRDVQRDAQLAQQLARAEKDNDQLLETLAGERESLSTALKQVVQLERAIEDLRDQLECTETTLLNKRDEVEAKQLEHEAAHEKILQLTEELSTLRTEPAAVDPEKRGNSLFAEVDDQRQHMKAVLAAQKKHYVQMKQQFAQSQQEIRALKRENAAMKKELEICGTLFLNADQTFKAKLNERISKLLNEIQHLESKLQFTENNLLSLANEKGVSWLDSMLTFCKNESNMYKDQLRQCRLHKAAVEEQLNNVELELARWRFEALKSRCLIINREQLLEDAGIAFDADAAVAPAIVQLARRMEQQPDVRPQMQLVRPKIEIKNEPKDEPSQRSVELAVVRPPSIKAEHADDDHASLDIEVDACNQSAERLANSDSVDIEADKENQSAEMLEISANEHAIVFEVNATIKSETTSPSPPKLRSALAASNTTCPVVARPKVTFASPPKTTSASGGIFTNASSFLAHDTKPSASVTCTNFIAPKPVSGVIKCTATAPQYAAPVSATAAVADATKCAAKPMKIRHVIVKSKTPTMYPK